MANEKKAAAKPAAPKKVYFTESETKKKYEVLGKKFIFKGEKFTAEKAVKNKDLMLALIASGAPSIVEV